MKNITLKILKSTFSETRLSPYLKNCEDPSNVLEKYHANVILSESMIPTLHYLEICLRNRIDEVFKVYYTSNWLLNPEFNPIISLQDKKKIDEIIVKIRREKKRNAMHDDVVAQMTFGFWCSFFHKKYDPFIWHRKDTFKIIFPNLPRMNRKRSFVEEKILKIKEIRNRIAHHEPVWNHKVSIFNAHSMCHELIEAMSYDAIKMLKMIDRFPKVYESINST